MIFSPTLADKVMSGEKTVTRRPVKSRWGDDAIPCRYKEGRTYAVQPGRGKKAIGRLRVLDVEFQPLSDALAEYREEGFPHPDSLRRYWSEMYGDYAEDQAVWRIEFEAVA